MLRFTAMIALLACLAGAVAEGESGAQRLGRVGTFMYQLDKLDDASNVAALAGSNYDMLVVEPTATVSGHSHFDMKAMVTRLHAGKPGRIVLAYLDAGQAESFRTYWQNDWKAPTKAAKGVPDFLLAPDPDGWSDDYPVAYWDNRWQAIIATGAHSQVVQLMNAGFDGLYLDWIDGWDDDRCVQEARRERVDPARAMVDFLLLIRSTARKINPAAVIVQQNAYALLDTDARLRDAIDALGVEDTWYSGKANAKWASRFAGDIPNRETGDDSTASRLVQYQKFIALGKPVFTIDYCVNAANAARVYREAGAHHLVPLVTRVSLDHMTETPPPAIHSGG